MKYEQSSAATEHVETRDASLLDLLLVPAKHKKFIIGLPVIATAIAIAVSFVVPPTYRASVTILPPQQSQSTAASMLAQMGGAMSVFASAAGAKMPSDVCMGMLKSRAIADQLVKRFDLRKTYKTDSITNARAELGSNTAVNVGRDGLITVTVDDGDKERVAKIANAYIEELSRLTREMTVTEASERRAFYERQLVLAKENLAAAEVASKKGLDTNRAISVESESRAQVQNVAHLRAQASAKEIDLKYNQMQYETLVKQYEVARLDEARDPALVQVLDPAAVPERPFWPSRGRLAVVTALVAFFAALALVYAADAISRAMRQPGVNRKWTAIRASWKS